MIFKIPPTLTIVLQKTVVKTWSMDGAAKVVTTEEVIPAFAVDSTNEKLLATARSWAKDSEITVPNNPTTLRLVAVEERNEGGRAWKVVTPEGYLFDLREDVVLEALLSGGCGPKGELSGEYIWMQYGPHTKLVRVGSPLYEYILPQATRINELKGLPKIPASKLEAGGVYQSGSGRICLYLGAIDYRSFRLTEATLGSHLFWEVPKEDETLSPDALLDRVLSMGQPDLTLKVQKTTPFVRLVDTTVLPDNVISILTNNLAATILSNPHRSKWVSCDQARILNMIPSGTTLPDKLHPIVDEYVTANPKVFTSIF